MLLNETSTQFQQSQKSKTTIVVIFIQTISITLDFTLIYIEYLYNNFSTKMILGLLHVRLENLSSKHLHITQITSIISKQLISLSDNLLPHQIQFKFEGKEEN